MLKKILNAYFCPDKIRTFDTSPRPGERTVAYAIRLREKCKFWDDYEDGSRAIDYGCQN